MPAYADERLSAFETTARGAGQRRGDLTHSPGLHTAQQGGFAQTLRKATAALTELAARLARGRIRRPPAKVQAEIDTIRAPLLGGRAIATELTGETPATLRLAGGSTRTPTPPWRRRSSVILVTDHDAWPLDQVIDAYRSRSTSKPRPPGRGPQRAVLRPIRHFTDKIRVHLFTCVLALAIST